MYWTLELASYLEDAPWPASKDELIELVANETRQDVLSAAMQQMNLFEQNESNEDNDIK